MIIYFHQLPLVSSVDQLVSNQHQGVVTMKPADHTNRPMQIARLSTVSLTGINHHYPNVLLSSAPTASEAGGKNCSLGFENDFPPVSDQTNDQSSGQSLVLPIQERFMSLNRGTIYEHQGMIVTPDQLSYQPLTTSYSQPVYYFIYNTDNYYHFLYDTIPYLWGYFHLKENYLPNLKLLMTHARPDQDHHYRFVTESLTLLGITSDDIILHSPGTTYDQLYVGSSLTHGGQSEGTGKTNCPVEDGTGYCSVGFRGKINFPSASEQPPRSEIHDLYQRMIQAARVSQQSANTCSPPNPKRIYISRRSWLHGDLSNIGTNYTSRRKLMIEDELVDRLTDQYQVTEIFAEQYSMAEKIMLFSQVELVIGAIGGGMANLLFSTPTTQAIILVSPTFLQVNDRFRYSMDHTKSHYYHDCYLYRFSDRQQISLYVRVKVIDSQSPYFGRVGEVQSYTSDPTELYQVKLGNQTTTGWNSQVIYEDHSFRFDQLEPQDSGLNSPWTFDVDTFLTTIPRECGQIEFDGCVAK